VAYGTYVDRGGQTHSQLLDLVLPAGAGAPTPLVIWIHGGGWATGSRLPIPSYVAALCAKGYAVASLDYRLTPVAIWPAQIQDAKGAVRFLRANAATYNLDPDRFAAWGESAGGHLAALLGTSGGIGSTTLGNVTVDLEGTTGGNPGVSSRVQAVVDWYGATDFVQMHFYPTTANHDAATSDESVFVGGPIQTRPELGATANPLTYASPDDPPFLLMHGTADQLIPYQQTELLWDALVAQGVSATFSPVQGAGHGNSPWTSSSAVWQQVYDFLAQNFLQAPQAPPATTAKRSRVPPVATPIEDASGTGLPEVTVVANDSTASQAGPDPGQLTVTRTGSTAVDLAVSYTLSGTAVAGTDYAALPGSVTIPAGSASATIDVTPLARSGLEAARFAVLTLTSGPEYTAGSPSAASVAFAADPLTGPVVSVVASDPFAAEPAHSGAFQLSRTGGTSSPLTVSITLGGTAQNGVDYTTVPSTITFAAGVSRVTVTIQPIDDYVTEPTETVTLTVNPDPSYLVGPYEGSRVTIADDDLPGLPTLTSLALSPAAVVGGNGSTGTVTLSGPAFSGGAVVSLASGDTNLATVPATVTVPAGATTATFTVTAKPVATTAPVQVSAFYRGVTRTAGLTVQEATLASVSVSPGSFAGSCKVPTSKVILTGKAPAGGVVLALSSSNPAASVPATVTVPAGASSAGFNVMTSAVTATQNGAISATWKGVTQSAGLTLRPITLLSFTLSPNPVTGGTAATGTATLECAAAPGDILVALSSTQPALASPAATTLTIPAGSSSGTVSVSTATVSAASTASIRASATGTTKTVILTVNP
jgi:acetyl esterase/lipase